MEPIIDHYELNIAATVELSGRTFHWGRLTFPGDLSLGHAQNRAHAIMATLSEEGLVFGYSLTAVHANTSHKVAI